MASSRVGMFTSTPCHTSRSASGIDRTSRTDVNPCASSVCRTDGYLSSSYSLPTRRCTRVPSELPRASSLVLSGTTSAHIFTAPFSRDVQLVYRELLEAENTHHSTVRTYRTVVSGSATQSSRRFVQVGGHHVYPAFLRRTSNHRTSSRTLAVALRCVRDRNDLGWWSTCSHSSMDRILCFPARRLFIRPRFLRPVRRP